MQVNDTRQIKKERIAIGSDHAGLPLKDGLIEELGKAGYNLEDFGTFTGDSVDYPDYARKVAEAVASGEYDKGIIVCGTGIGVSIAANKVRGIRAAACSEPYSAKMAREHNNANVLTMGARVVGLGLATQIATEFLKTEFLTGTRHERRVDKINAMDKCEEAPVGTDEE